MQYLDTTSKMAELFKFPFQDKQFNITVIQVYDLITKSEEAEVDRFYEDLQQLLEPSSSPPKKMSISSEGVAMQKQEVRRYLE